MVCWIPFGKRMLVNILAPNNLSIFSIFFNNDFIEWLWRRDKFLCCFLVRLLQYTSQSRGRLLFWSSFLPPGYLICHCKKNQKMIFPINYNGRKRTLTSVNLCFCFVCLSTISRPSSSRCFFLIRLNSLFMESFEPLSCELDESISIASKSKRCVNYE